MENLNYKKENIERKYLNKMQKNQFLKVKDSLLEIEKDFIELKDRELKEGVVKIKRQIEELFLKLMRAIKSIWYDWLINYIPKPIRKSVGGFKCKIVSLLKTNAPKQTVYGRNITN